MRRMSCILLSAIILGSADMTIAQEPTKPEAKGAPAPDVKPEPKPPDTNPPEPVKPEQGKPEHAKAVSSPMLTIKLAFMADPRLLPYDITVEMNGETVVLGGRVAQESQKIAAGEVAKSLVKSVTNNIDLDKNIDRDIIRKRDEAITHYVKERFAKSTTLGKADFGVKSDDGVVSLSGKTRFQVIVLEAAEAARQVPGVKAVKSDGVRLEGD